MIRTNLKIKKSSLIGLGTGVLFGIYFISLPLYGFDDRVYYVFDHAGEASRRFFDIIELNSVLVLISEPVWRLIMYLLSIQFPPELVIEIVIFTIPLMYFLSLSRLADSHKNFALFVILVCLTILFIPLLEKFTTHLRQGFAISLFLVALTLKSKFRYFLVLLLPLIHYSFYITSLIYFISILLYKNAQYFKIKHVIYTIPLLLIVFELTEYIGKIYSSELIMRYSDVYEGTGLGIFYYGIILSVFFVSGKKYLAKQLVIFSVISLILFIISSFTFGNPGRLLMNSFPIILLTGLQIPKKFSIVFFLLILGLIFI